MMFNWIIGMGLYNMKRYFECINSGRSEADCEQYKTKSWEAYIVYLVMRDFKIVQFAQSLGLWEEIPHRGGPIPNPVDPVAAYLNDVLILSFIQTIPLEGTAQPEPAFWFQKDGKGMPNYKTRLEATRNIHGELAGAMKKLEVQIKQLEALGK
jgi:hypothetical protein